jgi:hypothetical protein
VTDVAKFADEHGLSLDEATLILTRRSKPVTVGGRLAKALAVLQQAHAKVGAAPVALEGGELVKGEASVEGLERFYETKGGQVSALPNIRGRWLAPLATEDESQDPEDYP